METVIPEARTSKRSLTLSYRPPFSSGPLLAFLHDRAIPGVEEVRGATYRRSLSTSEGPAVIALTPMPDDQVRLETTLEDARALPATVRAARSLFDLDADPRPVARTLGRDALLRPLVRANAGIRVPGAADGFELAVRAILGQQVSVAAARTMLGRVGAAFGEPISHAEGGVVRRFPGAERLADARLEELGITGRRASAIRGVATLVAGGALDLTAGGDHDDAIGRLLQIDGIGPWTAAYVRMRALRDPDAFVSGDLGVRRAFERLGLDASPASVAGRAESWRPWRAYATMLLWQHEAGGGPAGAGPPRERSSPTSPRTSRTR
ncbi:MAG: DNA-3-methyladenine glycosylase family protein [Actinomycetota bacterium]